MIGYLVFGIFLVVFGYFYLTRDESKDIEKTSQSDLW